MRICCFFPFDWFFTVFFGNLTVSLLGPEEISSVALLVQVRLIIFLVDFSLFRCLFFFFFGSLWYSSLVIFLKLPDRLPIKTLALAFLLFWSLLSWLVLSLQWVVRYLFFVLSWWVFELSSRFLFVYFWFLSIHLSSKHVDIVSFCVIRLGTSSNFGNFKKFKKNFKSLAHCSTFWSGYKRFFCDWIHSV